MEGNKDEALRCVEIALEKEAQGNREGTIKFLKKSIALFPTDKAKDLLSFYSSSSPQTNGGGSTSSSNSTPSKSSSTTTSTTPSSTTSSPSEPAKAKYTVEQVELVKRIKKSKGNFYEVLEVTKTSTDIEIKKAYRKLALLMHPDKNQAPGSEDAFKIVTQAFSCLSDPEKRRVYDLTGSDDSSPRQSPFARSGMGNMGGSGYYEEELTPEDIFNIFFGIPTTRGNGMRNRQRYSYYSSDFGSPMHRQQATHTQFRRRPQGAQGQEQSSIFSLFMLLIPLLYILLNFFGGGGSDPALFGLTSHHPYTNQQTIKWGEYNVNYYVKSDFQEKFKESGWSESKLKENVLREWLNDQQRICKKKFMYDYYKNTIYSYQFKREYEQYADRFEYCESLLKENKIRFSINGYY